MSLSLQSLQPHQLSHQQHQQQHVSVSSYRRYQQRGQTFYSRSRFSSSIGYLRMSSSSNGNNNNNSREPDFNSNDPYSILGIPRMSNNNINEKELKRRYRTLAMKYHPDMTTTLDSTTVEKKMAADRFTKINTAYNSILNGIMEMGRSTTTSSSSSNAWEPPHRRTSSRSYTATTNTNTNDSNTNEKSTDWRDYMPRGSGDDDASYDTTGDSFGKIFTDFASTVIGGVQATSAAAVGSSSGAGIFQDFIDFLEQNVDGYSSSSGSGSNRNTDEDADLRLLLQVGTKIEIQNEMDESELVVQQLTNKLQKVVEELRQIQTHLSSTTTTTTATTTKKKTYSEILELQERNEELVSQQRIVENYIQRARKRLTKIQMRYKEVLLQQPQHDNDTTTAASSSRQQQSTTSKTYTDNPSSSPSYASTTAVNNNPSPSSSSSSSPSTSSSGGSSSSSSSSKNEEAFGTSFNTNRSRGSSRRRSTTTTSSSNPQQHDSSEPASEQPQATKTTAGSSFQQQQPQRQPRDTATRTTTSTTTTVNGYDDDDDDDDVVVPPHRRTSTTSSSSNTKSFAQRIEEDKQRLREIKVDEAFDQLKRDLGL